MSRLRSLDTRWLLVIAPLFVFGCFTVGDDGGSDDGTDDGASQRLHEQRRLPQRTHLHRSRRQSRRHLRRGRNVRVHDRHRHRRLERELDGRELDGRLERGRLDRRAGALPAVPSEGGSTTGGSATGGNATGGSATGGSSGASVCGPYCDRLVGAMCAAVTETACLADCNGFSADCPTEIAALSACVANPANTVMCVTGQAQIQGCDAPIEATDRCLICVPETADTGCQTCSKASCCEAVGDYSSCPRRCSLLHVRNRLHDGRLFRRLPCDVPDRGRRHSSPSPNVRTRPAPSRASAGRRRTTPRARRATRRAVAPSTSTTRRRRAPPNSTLASSRARPNPAPTRASPSTRRPAPLSWSVGLPLRELPRRLLDVT